MLHTAVTSAPSAFAICTANVPTPPAAPLTRTCCPGSRRPWSRSAWRAVQPAMGTAAACSKVTSGGFTAKSSSVPRTYSAKAPPLEPNTSSPGRSCVTLAPTSSTRPATSRPGMLLFGRRSPNERRMKYGSPRTRCQSTGLTDAALTRTSTLFASIVGSEISRSSSSSGGPYSWLTIAFIARRF